MEKIRNMSIRKTIIFYMTISLLCSFLLTAVTIHVAAKTQQQIWWKYTDQNKFYDAVNKEGMGYKAGIPRIADKEMNREDSYISEACDFLETYCGFFFFMTGCIVAVMLFYKNKLKVPIKKLTEASQRIADSDLDFHVIYDNTDELGKLCKGFETMRGQLEENNKELWRKVDDEKALRAAIAHDICSPLSVLRGYQEMLLEFVPSGLFDKEQILKILEEGMLQIERVDNFVEAMRKISKLEDRELRYKSIKLSELGDRIEKETHLIGRNVGKACFVHIEEMEGMLIIDLDIVLEVTENLFNNALRYADKRVEIDIRTNVDELILSVTDDGGGFTKSTEMLTRAYYHSNPQDDLKHFGMGMYLSNLYCEKHGGRLIAMNCDKGGAVVEAIFKMPSVEK